MNTQALARIAELKLHHDEMVLAKYAEELITIHKNLLEVIDKLNKKGDKGDAPSEEELLALIEPLITSKEEIVEEISSLLPTKEEIISEVLESVSSQIPEVKDGETPTDEKILSLMKPLIPKLKKVSEIDYALLAKRMEPFMKAMIKSIQPEKPQEITHEVVFGAIKDKLEPKHIKGLEVMMDNKMRPYLSGGGDTVGAGANITITDLNGRKVISSLGGTTYVETPTGLVNGSNKIYTVLHAVTTVLNFSINGQFIHPAEYSIVGTTITFVTALDATLSGTGFTIVYS